MSLHILLIIACVQSVFGILDQGTSPGTLSERISQVGTLKEQECPFGLYGAQQDSCICLSSGLWGISKDYCSPPLTWIGVNTKTQFCIPNNFGEKVQLLQKALTLEIPEVAQMSHSMHKLIDRFDRFTTDVPFIEDVYSSQSNLLSFGESQWKLTTVENETFCLVHGADNYQSHFCLFDQLTKGDKIIKIRSIEPNCSSELPKILPSRCNPLYGNRTCAQAIEATTSNITLDQKDTSAFIQFPGGVKLGAEEASLVMSPTTNPEAELEDTDKNLVKRVVTNDGKNESFLASLGRNIPSPSAQSSNIGSVSMDLLEEDEDGVKSGMEEIGHKLMRDQIDQYVDIVVAQLTGLADSAGSTPQGTQARLPVLKILNLIKLIMQRTCGGVKEEYFELALNSFLKVQLESFHVKEPYIMHNVFIRMEYALKTCYNNAKPHVFVKQSMGNNNTNDTENNCPDMKWEGTSDELDVHGDGSEVVKLEATPAWASGVLSGGATKEPLIESVWKMLVNAHSYCYPYFKAYFNDHHALTVALLPLFNNQIQDIWLKEGGYDTSKGKLYGNLLGDIKKVLEDVDNCVAASRYLSQYPWYMSIPLKDSNNKWRRKRDVGPTDVVAPSPIYVRNGNILCLFDPDDPVAFLGKPVCT